MRRLWGWLGRAWVASSLLRALHRTGVPAWHTACEISVTKSRTDCDLTHTTQMVGGIKPSSPGMKNVSRQAFSLPTMSSPSGEERTPGASAQVERALDGAAAALTVACTRVLWPCHCHAWSWSHHPQGRAWAAAPSEVDTLGRAPY